MLNTAEPDKYRDYYPLFSLRAAVGIRQGGSSRLKALTLISIAGSSTSSETSHGEKSVCPRTVRTERLICLPGWGVLSDLLSKWRAEALRNELQKPADERRSRRRNQRSHGRLAVSNPRFASTLNNSIVFLQVELAQETWPSRLVQVVMSFCLFHCEARTVKF